MKKTVIIVDSNNADRHILSQMLEKKCTILEADNGKSLLDLLENPDGDICGIILDTDIVQTKEYELLDSIKSNPRFFHIPVLISSHNAGDAWEIAALSHGAEAFLPKPYNPQLIRHRILSAIRLDKKAAAPADEQKDSLT